MSSKSTGPAGAVRVAVLSVGRGDLPDSFASAFAELAAFPMPGLALDFLALGGLRSQLLSMASAAAGLAPAGILETEPRYRQYKLDCVAYALAILPVLRARRYDLIHYFDPPLRTPLEKAWSWLGRPRLLYSDAGSIAPPYYPVRSTIHLLSRPAWEEALRMGVDSERLVCLPLGVGPGRLVSPLTGRNVLVPGAVADPRARLHYVTQELAGIQDSLLLLEQDPGPGALRLARERLEGRVRVGASVMSDASIAVFARTEDPLGLPLIRALNSGLPVVADDAWQFRWLLEECGYTPASLVDLRRPGRLRTFLEGFFADPAPYQARAQEAAVTVRRRFGWETLGPRYASLYCQLVAGGPVDARSWVEAVPQ